MFLIAAVESLARLARGEPGTSALGLRDTPSSHTNLPDPSRLGGLPGGATSPATHSPDRQRLGTAWRCTDQEPQVADAGSGAHDSGSVRLRVRGGCWWVPELGKTEAALKPDTSALAVAVPRAGELGKAGWRLEFGPTHSGCPQRFRGRGIPEDAGPASAAFHPFPAESLAIQTWGSAAPAQMAPTNSTYRFALACASSIADWNKKQTQTRTLDRGMVICIKINK